MNRDKDYVCFKPMSGGPGGPPWSPREPKEQGPTPPANRCPTCDNKGMPKGCPKCMRFT